MKPKILIINSDSPHNKGDQAILLGNIKLIKSLWKEADITAISDLPSRDEAWFKINFIKHKVYTLNPISIAKTSIQARKYDYVFWGGGELLKDYTNKIAPLYWLLRLSILKCLGVKVYGMFQGIGPTKSKISKLFIAKTVNMTDIFFVRDQESKEKLLSFGVITSKVISGYDPAVLNEPDNYEGDTLEDSNINLDEDFIRKSIIVSLRKWFHYSQSTWLPAPFQYTPRTAKNNTDIEIYKKNVSLILNNLIEKENINIIFFPMFTTSSQGDSSFSFEIFNNMKKDRAAVLETSKISPQAMFKIFSLARGSFCSRLHSSIISTAMGTPSVCLYYVDKGRIYFDQINSKQNSFPIDFILTSDGASQIESRITKNLRHNKIEKESLDAIRSMRQELITIFKKNIKPQ